jgi:hypothetical protein
MPFRRHGSRIIRMDLIVVRAPAALVCVSFPAAGAAL